MSEQHPENRQPPSTSRKLLGHGIKLVLTLLVLYFVGRQVWLNWDQVKLTDWQVNLWYLIPSLIMTQVAVFVFAGCWKRIISGFGHTISVPMSFKVFNLSNLGRYIPGKIWQVFGMLYLARKEGVPGEQAAASFVIVQLFTIPASFLVYVLAAQVEPVLLTDQFAIMGQGSAYLVGALFLLACSALIFAPQPILRLANFFLQKLGRQPANFALDKRVALQIFVGYFCGWILFGLAYWLMLRSVLGENAPSMVASIGLYNVAYQIGYLALFAPGGLGPREWIMGELLKPLVGPIGPALAVLARIWSVLVDSLAAVIALTIRKKTVSSPE
ncbi:MAG: flippase-like domain-containing protein [bacterium]|nr:flippase-like domain-containing protein [bacterium]